MRPSGPCLARVSPPCPRLAVDHGRCAHHALIERRFYDRQRGTASQRGYGTEWRRVRAEVLAAHPLCACGAPATDVDHSPRYPTLGPDHAAYVLTSYCHRHHSARTSRQVR